VFPIIVVLALFFPFWLKLVVFLTLGRDAARMPAPWVQQPAVCASLRREEGEVRKSLRFERPRREPNNNKVFRYSTKQIQPDPLNAKEEG
jgi:hypothetical protein